MKSYKDVKAQIAKLQKQAEALRTRELKSVIAQVRRTIAQYELTPADLGLAGGSRGRPAGVQRGSRGRVSIGVAKYRDPATGKTWTGRGRPPTWMIGVKDPSAYLIDGASAGAKPAVKKAKAAAKKTRAPRKAAAKKGAGAKPGRKRAAAAPAESAPAGA